MDESVLQEYMEFAGENINWIGLWNSKLGFCTSKGKYNIQFNRITQKAEKKLQSFTID